jgi:hypothetical protein
VGIDDKCESTHEADTYCNAALHCYKEAEALRRPRVNCGTPAN